MYREFTVIQRYRDVQRVFRKTGFTLWANFVTERFTILVTGS